MAYQINSEWQEASLLTGFPIGQQLSIQNAGRAGDIIEIIVSDTQPIEGQRSYVIRSLDPLYRVSGQSSEVWIRYIRYDLNGTITPQPARTCLANITDNEQISEASALPVDLYTKPGPDKRVKVSEESALSSAVCNELGYFISGSASVVAGQSISFNVSVASDVVVRGITATPGLPIAVYNEFATGTADGIFTAKNLNLCGIDFSPSQAQIMEVSTPAGDLLSFGQSSIDSPIFTCVDGRLSITVENDTPDTKTITIGINLEELGERSAVFGLTPSTFLTPTTEMGTYG